MGEVLWSMIWLFLFIIWIFLVFRVFQDIFRSRDMGGVAKALWVLFVVGAPYLGILAYLIVRGAKMAENEVNAVRQNEEQVRAYIRDVAGSSVSPAAEIERLANLRQQGFLTDEEFASLKAKVLA